MEKGMSQHDLRLIQSSPVFDKDFYASQYDIGKEHMSPEEHYLTKGWEKGYDPSPYFDTKWYLMTYPDVYNAKVNPLLHYIC